jgi:hypothetical protein
MSLCSALFYFTYATTATFLKGLFLGTRSTTIAV